MFEQFRHEIKAVVPDSIADQLGVCAGDRLVSIDGKEIEDILDYRILINSSRMLMLIEKPNGEQWELDIEHDYEDPGLEFGEVRLLDAHLDAGDVLGHFLEVSPFAGACEQKTRKGNSPCQKSVE